MQNKLVVALVVGLAFAGQASAAADAEMAKAYAKKNDCFKCHAPDKTKKGPSYKKIAEEIRAKGKTDAKLFEHLTTGRKVKLEDGSEEEHKALDKGDTAEIKNLISWIREH
jgi:cytochrome c